MRSGFGRRRRAVCVLAGATLCGTALSASDAKLLPPELRSFASPSGRYLLQVSGPPRWQPPRARAEMFLTEGAALRSLWSRALPQRFGPGQALASDRGGVVMFDEWVKTPSDYAVEVVDLAGMTVSRHSMTDVARVSGVATADLVASARVGPWMSAPPLLVVNRDVVTVEAGHVRLEVDLRSGDLVRASASRR